MLSKYQENKLIGIFYFIDLDLPEINFDLDARHPFEEVKDIIPFIRTIQPDVFYIIFLLSLRMNYKYSYLWQKHCI